MNPAGGKLGKLARLDLEVPLRTESAQSMGRPTSAESFRTFPQRGNRALRGRYAGL
jgi:hypothetical protein